MTHLLAALWLPGLPQPLVAWQAEPWPASGLLLQGKKFREGNAPEPAQDL